MTDAPKPSPDKIEAMAQELETQACRAQAGSPCRAETLFRAVTMIRALSKADQIIAMQAPAVGGEASDDLTVEQALERLVIYTAMEDGQLAMNCERIIRAALPSTAVGGGQEALGDGFVRARKPRPYPHAMPGTGKFQEYFGFEGGSLTVKTLGYGPSDGKGWLCFHEDALEPEYGEDGRNYHIANLEVSELIFLRDKLIELWPLAHPTPVRETKCYECSADLMGPYCPACNPPTPVREPEGAREHIANILRVYKADACSIEGTISGIFHALAQPTPPSLGEGNQELSSSQEPALAASGRNAGAVGVWRCTRCNRDEIDARANGCTRGPCPMVPR